MILVICKLIAVSDNDKELLVNEFRCKVQFVAFEGLYMETIRRSDACTDYSCLSDVLREESTADLM